MTQGYTLGVLSTSFGGAYFGELLASISANQDASGGRLVAIQTLDAGTFKIDVREPPAFPYRVAWDQVCGFVVILNAVSSAYLQAARDAGLPVVVISDIPADFECPLVLPDNFGGTKDATEHLIQHGHRRIAFAGLLRQGDVLERYEAYRQTMLDHGLSPDPELFFDTGDMQVTGGERAARAMVAAGMPSTAVIAGNDDNATGIIRTLNAAGLHLPEDQAIIGFDDTEDNTYRLNLRLTSVRLPLEEMGDLAADLVKRMAAGEQVEPGRHRVATTLTVRESCGCSDAQFVPGEQPRTQSAGDGESRLRERLSVLLGARLPKSHLSRHQGEIRNFVAAIALAVRTAVESDEVGPDELDDPALLPAMEPFATLVTTKEHVLGLFEAAREYGFFLLELAGKSKDEPTRKRLEQCLDRILVMTIHNWSTTQADRVMSVTQSMNTQYSVSMELLRSQERDPRSLEWLWRTQLSGGCLGLWPTKQAPDERTTLEVVASFDRKQGSVRKPAESSPLRSFPPENLLAMAAAGSGDMVFVSHLKVDSGDWGMLALVGPVQTGAQTGRETMNQLAALLSVALEHESVLKTMREQEQHLRRAALYDELTGLPNRALFRQQLTMAMTRSSRRETYHYAVLVLDLDGFKLVNDSLGHQAGDQLLQLVAQRIDVTLRSIDTAARFGGDEFAVLLEAIDGPEAAVTLAERLQEALCAPYYVADTDVVVSASIGIAPGGSEYRDTESIMRDADAAMYHAKAAGKRRHALFAPAMHAAAVDRLQIEGDLRRSLENDDLKLYYQPIMDLRTGRMSGAEALIRWQHPTRGLLLPGTFLAVAEESGIILGLGSWVLEEACRQQNKWGTGDDGAAPFTMSLNVSNREFWHGHLIDEIKGRLSYWGLPPACLAIEITEGVIMHDVKLASTILSNLKELGVQVHIDDFGTGYSSLEALHDLSIDALKIDRSFISRLTTSARSKELVRTIVTMGLNLGLDVIAEGIETAEELALVKEMGCSHGQGYLYSRPVPGEVFRALLAGQHHPVRLV
jgi:diguanylate cyclase (GGDEF)-like protein